MEGMGAAGIGAMTGIGGLSKVADMSSPDTCSNVCRVFTTGFSLYYSVESLLLRSHCAMGWLRLVGSIEK